MPKRPPAFAVHNDQYRDICAIARWLVAHAPAFTDLCQAQDWASLAVIQPGYDRQKKLRRDGLTIPAPATLE